MYILLIGRKLSWLRQIKELQFIDTKDNPTVTYSLSSTCPFSLNPPKLSYSQPHHYLFRPSTNQITKQKEGAEAMEWEEGGATMMSLLHLNTRSLESFQPHNVTPNEPSYCEVIKMTPSYLFSPCHVLFVLGLIIIIYLSIINLF